RASGAVKAPDATSSGRATPRLEAPGSGGSAGAGRRGNGRGPGRLVRAAPPGPHVEERREEQQPADDDERDDPVDRVEAREVDGQHLGEREREEAGGAQAERAAPIPEAEPHRGE